MALARPFAWFIGIAATLACMPVGGPGGSVVLTNEDVVIVWDKEHGVEHFIRQAAFAGDGKEFGFIVPSPAEPEFAVADERVFSLLRSQIPRPSEPMSIGCAKAETMAVPASTVSVLRTEQVGDYKATVLKAADGAALSAWLHNNGFVTSPSTPEWLQGYAARNWVFTAFKFSGDLSQGLETQAIRMSFKTDHPEYPYSMPRDDWAASGRKSMNVFFVSSSAVEGRYESSRAPWGATVRWSGPVQEDSIRDLAANLKLPASDLPASPTLTVFRSSGDANGYASDLYFVPTAMVNSSKLGWWFGAVLVLGLLGWRMRLRSPAASL